MWLTGVLSLGCLPGQFLAGLFLAGNLLKIDLSGIDTVSRAALRYCLGLAAWTGVSFALAAFGLFNAPALGLLGWLLAAAALYSYRGRWSLPELSRPQTALGLLATGLLLFNGFFAAESIQGGRDQGAYALHGASIARTGELAVPLPFDGFADPDGAYHQLLHISNPLGFNYDLEDRSMRGQFPPSLAVNLAQFHGIAGYHGMLWFVPLLSAVNFLLFYGLARRFCPVPWALLAAFFFALNPAQLWNARITLSEVLAQSLILSGLLLTLDSPLKVKRNHLVGIALLAASSFVRIDCFLFATIIPVANFARVALADAENLPRQLKASHQTNATVFAVAAIAWLYYEYNTPNYFHEFTHIVGAFLAAGGLAWLASLALPGLRSGSGRRIVDACTSSRAWLALSALVATAFLYALLVRPHLEPFAQFENPHYGDRDYRENSLVDLAAYLSYPLLALSLFGYLGCLRKLMVGRQIGLAILLVAWTAFSIAYLQNPRISPDHIWRIRRFTPIIIPGFILFAALGASLLQTRFPQTKLLPRLCWIGAAAFLAYASAPVAFLKQYQGTIPFIQRLDARIPPQALVVCDITTRLYSPLHLGQGREIVRGDLGDPAQRQLIDQIATTAAQEGRPVTLLSHSPLVSELSDYPTAQLRFDYPYLAANNTAPARERAVNRYRVYLAQIDGPIRPFSGRETYINVGATEMIGISETGLHGQEFANGTPARWTEAHAILVIPRLFEQDFRFGKLVVLSAREEGAQTTLSVDGATALQTRIPPEGGTFLFTLPPPGDHDETIEIEINTETFIPSQRDPTSADGRELGIRIAAIWLQTGERIAVGNARFGATLIPGIDTFGLHPIEVIDNVPQRWTDGEARYEFTLREGFQPSKLEIDIASSFLPNNPLEVLWNGTLLHQRAVPKEGTRLNLDLGDLAAKGSVTLELRSRAASPSERGMGEDERRLGLRIRAIELKGQPRHREKASSK